MKRSAFKSPCILLLGLMLGWGIGRVPGWGGGTGADGNQRPELPAQRGYGAGHGGWPAGSKSKAGAGDGGFHGKPGRERVEMLAARFRSKSASDGRTAEISLMAEMAELSPEDLGAVIGLLAGEKIDGKTYSFLLIRWAMLDPKAALAFALEQQEHGSNLVETGTIVGELAKVDLPAAKAALAQLNEEQRNSAGRVLVRQLMRSDIRAAVVCARELEYNDVEVDVMRSWADSDLRAAAEELTLGQVRDLKVAEEIAARMMEEDRGAFEAWVERLADPAQKAVARRVSLTADATADPKGAALATAAWLASEPEASDQAGDLPGQIVQGLIAAEGRHAEVAAWAAGLPQGLARDTAIIQAGRLWMEQDMMQSSGWLGSLPEGFGRDGAVLYLVEKITGETPADAFEWTRTIHTPELRKAALERLAEIWKRQDPEAARQALRTLPPGDWDRLRKASQEESE